MNSCNSKNKEAIFRKGIDNLSLAGTIADSCEPLKTTFGIEHFSCHMLFQDHQYITVSNNVSVYQSMQMTCLLQDIPMIILQGLGRAGIFLLHEKTQLLENVTSYKNFIKENNFSESLCLINSITKTREQVIVMFTFDIKNSCSMAQYNLINNIDLLKEFSRYFLCRFKSKMEKLVRMTVDKIKNENYFNDFKEFIAASLKIKNDARNHFIIWLHKHQLSQNRIMKPYLTEREKQILILTYQNNFTSKQIAEHLLISTRTVERHFENMRLKLNAFDKLDLVNKAFALGLLK